MGLRAVGVAIALLLLAPSGAWGQEPARGPEVRGLLQAVFALNVEQPSVGLRLHPRAAFGIWRGSSPRPSEGTLEVGLFGGWSHRPMVFRAALPGSASLEGTGAHHALLMGSVGHGVHAQTPGGHLFQFGRYLMGGWAYRRDAARIVDERYEVDSSWSESVHGGMAGTLASVAVLFDGRVGPSFEASYLLGASRGLACWHLGLGVAARIGPGDTGRRGP